MHHKSPKNCSATWIAFVVLTLFLCPAMQAVQSITLAWNPSSSPFVVGYLVYYGTDGTNFDNQMDVGTNTSATMTGLQQGTTNAFEVVAYDINRVESPPSNLIEYVVPITTDTIYAQTNGTDITILTSGNGTLAQHFKSNVFQEGKHYTLTAAPAKGSLFAGWVSNGVVVTTSPTYSFLLGSNVVLQANFITNPFIPITGPYNGLFYVANDASVESSGAFNASLTSAGTYTARLRLGAASYSFSGNFSASNGVAFKIVGPKLSPINVQLQLDFSGGPMTGTISDGSWSANLLANRSIYSKTNLAPQAGRYTLLIPGVNNAPGQPGGNGFGAVTVNTLGAVSLSGTLGDGTPFISSSVAASQGQWPFYLSLYGGKGSVLAWLSFATNGDINGQVEWFKMPMATAKLYPGGFTNSPEAVGSIYKYTNGVPVLAPDGGAPNEGLLSLVNGDLAESITNQVGLGPIFPAGCTNKLSVQTLSGMFHGTVFNPATRKPIAVSGIVLQNQNYGAGYFLGTNECGSVSLSVAP